MASVESYLTCADVRLHIPMTHCIPFRYTANNVTLAQCQIQCNAIGCTAFDYASHLSGVSTQFRCNYFFLDASASVTFTIKYDYSSIG